MITLGNVYFQTEIATSTMHVEYIVLLTGMREFLPVKNTLNKVCDVLDILHDEKTKVIKVHEDNEGALKLASGPLEKVTPQVNILLLSITGFRKR